MADTISWSATKDDELEDGPLLGADTSGDAPTAQGKRTYSSVGQVLRQLLPSLVGNFSIGYNYSIIEWALNWNSARISAELRGMVLSGALFGCMAGMLVFGYAGDRLGRHRAMFLTLCMIVLGAVGCGSAFGDAPMRQLVLWRFVLGTGLGGMYPLSAVSAAESEQQQQGSAQGGWLQGKEMRVGTVFCCGAFGSVAAPLLVSLVSVLGLEPGAAWRVVLILGGLPTLCILPGAAAKAFPAPDEEKTASRQPAKDDDELSHWEVLRRLIGTAGSWFLFDVVVFGVMTAMPDISRQILGHGSTASMALSTAAISSVTVPASILSLVLCRDSAFGRKRLQQIGFLVNSMGLFLLAFVYHNRDHHEGGDALLTMAYVCMIFMINFGTPMTTFMLPAETFPPSIRSTCNGVSAAVGKMGAIVGAAAFAPFDRDEGLTLTLGLCTVFSIMGALLTTLFTVGGRKNAVGGVAADGGSPTHGALS